MLPLLYKQTKTGAIQTYQVTTEGPEIIVTQGQLDGKKQSYRTLCEPKNVGRANETTASEQASLEAASKHAKKKKSGYVEDPSGEIQILLPQKVKTYVGNEKKITFPAYSTFKANGVNGTYWLKDGKLILTSRGGDEYPPIPHLEPLVKKAMLSLGTDCFNGELYIHGEHLQDITSAVKKPKELSKQLTFIVFELPNIDKSYTEKIEELKKIVSYTDNPDNPFERSHYLSYFGCLEVNSHEDVESHYNLAMEAGYEGTVIYNADAEYKFNERSSSVYKYKKAQDAEFQIVAYEFDKNNHVVYTCKTSENKSFKVKRKGTAAERELDAQNASDNLGKWLKVEFEVLSKDNIPLKPVGLTFRECDVDGNPLE